MIAVPGLTPTLPTMARRARVSHRRGAKDREALRSTQYGCQQKSVLELFERLRSQAIPALVSSRRDRGRHRSDSPPHPQANDSHRGLPVEKLSAALRFSEIHVDHRGAVHDRPYKSRPGSSADRHAAVAKKKPT